MKQPPQQSQPHAYYDEWVPTPWGFGTAGGIDSFAAPRDVVAELHAVVEEVTGKPVARPSRRIGFLP